MSPAQSVQNGYMPQFIDPAGVPIRYYVWPVDRPRAVIQLAHGLGEHATRYLPFAHDLNAAGYSVYANDHRGHGETGLAQHGGDYAKLGKLGPGGLSATIAGIREFSRIIAAENPGLPLVLLGHSWGSLMAQKIINVASAEYAGLILTGTAYRMPTSMNAGNLNRKHAVSGGHGYEWLSRDQEVQRAAAADRLMFTPNVLALFGIRDGLSLYGRPAKKLETDIPVLILVGSEDALGGEKSAVRLAESYRKRSGLSDVTLQVYPNARHEILNETNRDEVIADLISWLNERITKPALPAS